MQVIELTNCRITEDLSNLYHDFTPGTTGQNLIVRAEHIVELIHRIDYRLNLAYTKEDSD